MLSCAASAASAYAALMQCLHTWFCTRYIKSGDIFKCVGKFTPLHVFLKWYVLSFAFPALVQRSVVGTAGGGGVVG